MDRVYGAFGKLLGTRGSPRARKQQTVRMDRVARRALQTTVQEETSTLEAELQQTCQELENAIAQHAAAVEKEQFLAVRIRKYQAALDQQAQAFQTEQKELAQLAAAARPKEEQAEEETKEEITTETAEDPEEGNSIEAKQADLERRMEKWETDQDALQKIVQTHKDILVRCEEMRRSIDVLEKKKQKIEHMSTECDDFLTTARQAEERDNENNGMNDDEQQQPDDDHEEPLNEMEMANRSSSAENDDNDGEPAQGSTSVQDGAEKNAENP